MEEHYLFQIWQHLSSQKNSKPEKTIKDVHKTLETLYQIKSTEFRLSPRPNHRQKDKQNYVLCFLLMALTNSVEDNIENVL